MGVGKIMDDKILEHLKRLKDAAFNRYDLADVGRYITEKTYLNGERFSFKDHEYQQDIISDTSRVIYCMKCAQVGLTEIQIRYALAVARMIPYLSVIMSWPYAGDASNVVKTRINITINDSPDLRDNVDPNLDNVEVKAIGTSLIYARGTSGTTSALSVPADMLIHDEVDRSDPAVLAQYQSRIKHSKYKLVRAFGTPTIAGYGIALMMETAKRKRHMCKCEHCNHYFSPDYETDVHIPGFDRSREKKEINKYNLHKIRWQEAILLCPKCFKEPSLQPEHREWIVENQGDNFDAVGYFVTPFSAPNVVSIPSLVRESTVYLSYSEFENQALGKVSSDSNEQLSLVDVQKGKVQIPLDSSELHHMGIDVGLLCHITIGRITQSGELLVVHKERCVSSKIEERKRELAAKYRCVMTVMDAYPYTDTVLRMQGYDANLLGGIYHDVKGMEVYSIQMAPAEVEKGKLPINQAKIHRNLNFDQVMNLFKEGKILWRAGNEEEDELFEKHCLDMKRKQEVNRMGEIIYNWVKSNGGQDHYHHSLGYLYVACRLAGVQSRNIPFGSAVPILSAFRVRQR